MKKLTRILVPILLFALIVCSIGWYLFVYDRDFTRDALLSQARFHDLHGNSRISSMFYNMAYDHSGRDENVAIELANQYKSDGNYTKAEYTLSNAINNGGTVELYTALCKTYVQQDKLLDAVNMLENIANPEIKAQLDALRPATPTANYDPGFYNQYIQVELESDSWLFYTTDGEYPTTSRSAYSEPITLPAGQTTIYAVGVNEDGLVSPLTIISYTVGGVIEPVTFTDDAIETALRETIGANSSDILYTNELWGITEFTVPEEASSFEDLRYLIDLKSLTMQDKNIDSLSCLAPLANLKKLDLTGCSFPVEDLSILASLPSLTDLSLAKCSLSTIEGLSAAQNLVTLDLQGNNLRNLTPLNAMLNLKELYLQHNAVTSVAELSNLTNLEKLDISFNSVTNMSPLASCLKLNWLCADNNQLSTLEGMDKLPLLAHLSVDYNKLKTVSILGNCTELVNLSFANNEIAEISSLGVLTKLEILDFSYNQVKALPVWDAECVLRTIDGSHNSLSSIDGLKNLDQIAYIYMDYNNLTNVDALADCYHLVQLNVFGNDINNVSKLTDHNIIVNYDPT